jgi:hypothetical protein
MTTGAFSTRPAHDGRVRTFITRPTA